MIKILTRWIGSADKNRKFTWREVTSELGAGILGGILIE